MTSHALPDTREVELVREAAEWRLVSLLFECPGPAWRGHVQALMQEVSDLELQAAARYALEEAGEGLFHHTFGPGGPAPPREASYHQTVQLGYLMSELQAYYNGFAFAPATAEPADHISVETAFLAYLRLKQAFALHCGDEERAAVTAEAAESFLKQHLANIAQDLGGRLAGSGIRYLEQAGAWLSGRVGPPPTAVSPLPILHDEPLEGEWGCDMSNE